MIGFYDYTVILTYMSLISASIGIVVSLNGTGHPYMGVFFLLFCGLCDAFDGKVARTKKDRTGMQKSYGIQIDSLSDLVAFGVLPACIGNAMIRVSPTLDEVPRFKHGEQFAFPVALLFFIVVMLYILAALIRLAWFNVTEEERQKNESCGRMFYTGLPVTSAALIFPSVLLLQYLIPADITPAYFVVMLITAILFLAKFKIRKAGIKGILIMVAIGIVEFIILVVRILSLKGVL
ncbi:MAG: phosphatidylserine synthase [Lachnospiraceae bacterium]|nr:phosphatidylserine synthase [Lachnospiraceae bacterium]